MKVNSISSFRVQVNSPSFLAGIPNVKWFGIEGEYNVMVMDLLGPSLEDLFTLCKQKFTLKTILILADQIVLIHLLTISSKELNTFILRGLYIETLSQITL
jgi:hypothetical protein